MDIGIMIKNKLKLISNYNLVKLTASCKRWAQSVNCAAETEWMFWLSIAMLYICALWNWLSIYLLFISHDTCYKDMFCLLLLFPAGKI